MREAIKDFINRVQPRFLVIALMLSFGLWYFSLNFADPVTYENFTLTLQLRSEDILTENSRVIENRRELDNILVNVHVTGLKSELDNLIQDETIFAYIDLQSSELINVTGSRLRVPIPVRISVDFSGVALGGDFRLTSVFPEMTSIVLDRIEPRVQTLTVEREGELPEGYIAETPMRDPRTVNIRGPAAVIAQIAWMGTIVDLTDVRTDIEDVRPIVAYNSLGDIVTGFTIDNFEEFSFRVPVYKIGSAQIQINDPAYTGDLASNQAVTKVEWEPKTIELKGHVDEVENIQIITLDPADVTDLASTQTFTYDINDYLARYNSEQGINVYLLNAAENIVNVTYVIEPITTQQYVIPLENVLILGESLLYGKRTDILTESLTITLSGVESVIQVVKADDIICRLDVSSLAEMEDGEHTLVLSIQSPAGTEITGSAPTVTLTLKTYEADSDAYEIEL